VPDKDPIVQLGPWVMTDPVTAVRLREVRGVNVLAVAECPPGMVYGLSEEMWEHVRAHGPYAQWPPPQDDEQEEARDVVR
jgi:hypothetical protein